MTRSFDDIDKLLNLDFTSFQGFSSRMDHLVSLDVSFVFDFFFFETHFF